MRTFFVLTLILAAALLLWAGHPAVSATIPVPCAQSNPAIIFNVTFPVGWHSSPYVILLQPISGVPPFTFTGLQMPPGCAVSTDGVFSCVTRVKGTWGVQIRCDD